MNDEITRTYSNGEVTVIWKAGLCTHSTNCFRGLPSVFDPRKRPWVDPQGAPTQQIVAQVKKCPSSALSFRMNGADKVTNRRD